MIKWKRPSGRVIETNDSDSTISYAVANGWERVKPAKKAGQATKKAVANGDSIANSERSS